MLVWLYQNSWLVPVGVTVIVAVLYFLLWSNTGSGEEAMGMAAVTGFAIIIIIGTWALWAMLNAMVAIMHGVFG